MKRDPGPSGATPYDGAGADRDNCELSDRDSRDLDMNNPTFFDTTGNFDFYERSAGRDGGDGECLDGNKNSAKTFNASKTKYNCLDFSITSM